MAEAYIVEAVRSPVGRRNGGLSTVHPADLGGATLKALVERADVDPAAIDDVVMGCLDQVGPQAFDVARAAWLAGGLPESVPATTIDRQCGSSQQAVHFAAQAVMSGVQDLVVAGGVQNMSMVPMNTAGTAGEAMGLPHPWFGSKGFVDRYGTEEISQFRGAEMLAERYDISREEMEDFAVASHRKALEAREQGRFEEEISPVEGVVADEGPRVPDLDKIRSLPTLTEGGRLTAALASQISDGASAVLVASERALEEHGLEPLARVHHMTVVGDDPVIMLSAPIPATRRALERTGLDLDDMDLIEINEAFASVVLAWKRELDADLDRVNVNGGAIALGHPLGATGTRLMTTLIHELRRRGGRYGMQVMCEGGGQANLTIVETL